jgi:translation initiation factor RLI1
MGFVQSYLQGRIPQENVVFCWKSVKHKKKNTQEFKMGIVQSYLKGRILQESLVFRRKSVKYKKKNTQGLKWELFRVT